MVTIDPDLAPSDAAVAVRSFPRRFRAVLVGSHDPDRDDPDELARRFGPEGTSAVEHLLAADGVLGLLAGVLRSGHRADAVAHPAVADLEQATWDDPGTEIEVLLEHLGETATTAAAAIDQISPDGWGAPITVAGNSAATPLISILREAVAVVANHLRRAQRVLDAVR